MSGYGFQSPYDRWGPATADLSVPHVKHVTGGMPPGTMVTVMGEIPRGADRFSINLLTRNDAETLLHLNPRFDQGKVVRNSHLQGSWGPEETDGGLPLNRGQPFGCIILARDDKYLIAFNGQHFTEYQFRAPSNVDHIRIAGDVKLKSVEMSGNPMMPMPAAVVEGGGYAPPGPTPTTIFTPPVPFKAKVGGGMIPGRTLTLSMVPRHNPERIRIDLQKDMEATEIAFHMDIRFDVSGHKRIICLNSYKHGHWGDEARYHHFPFEGGVGFDLVIQSNPTGYMLFTNGVQLAFFEHRDQNLSGIDILHIQGDAKITRVAF